MGKKSRKSTEELIAKRKAKAAASAFVARPFEGLPFETDLVALKELVPAATATAKLTEEHGGEEVTFASLLPAAWQSFRRSDGALMAGLQVPHSSPDPSRDIAWAILEAKDAEPGTGLPANTTPGEGPRLQDILDLSVPFTVDVTNSFEYWLAPDADDTDELAGALEQANESISPSTKLESVESAYWTEMGERTFVRWIMDADEDSVLNALARLHAAGTDTLGETGRYLGCFRAHGVVAPVWELDFGTTPEVAGSSIKDLSERFAKALAVGDPLSFEERRAKAGVVSRQLTIR